MRFILGAGLPLLGGWIAGFAEASAVELICSAIFGICVCCAVGPKCLAVAATVSTITGNPEAVFEGVLYSLVLLWVFLPIVFGGVMIALTFWHGLPGLVEDALVAALFLLNLGWLAWGNSITPTTGKIPAA
jgi:hypothetical protein